MNALIICRDIQFAELLTVALRQVGLRGVVRRTVPTETSQFSKAAITLIDTTDLSNSVETLKILRTLATVPMIAFTPAENTKGLLDLYESGATSVILLPCDLRIVAAQALALTRLVAVTETAMTPHPLLDPETQRIRLPNGNFRLTTLEYRLLSTLLSRPGRVFSPETLVVHVWGYSGDGDRGLVKGLVNRVRRKIEPTPQEPRYLVTEIGVGYRFVPPLIFEESEDMDETP